MYISSEQMAVSLDGPALDRNCRSLMVHALATSTDMGPWRLEWTYSRTENAPAAIRAVNMPSQRVEYIVVCKQLYRECVYRSFPGISHVARFLPEAGRTICIWLASSTTIFNMRASLHQLKVNSLKRINR
jgi:hypothetical protein